MKQEKIEQALLHFKAAASAIEDGVLILNEVLGDSAAVEDFAAYRRTQLRVLTPSKIQNINFLGIRQKNTILEEINNMLIQLNLSLKARERKDGRFEIRPTINGKKVSIYGKTADELAKKYEQALKKRTHTTAEPPKSKITLFVWLDEWLEIYKKPNVAKNTYDNLQRCIKKQIKGNLSNKPINRYTVQELTLALNAIESTRMRKYARGTLRDAFACAVNAGHLKENVVDRIAQVKHVSKNGKAIPLLDILDMIENAVPKLSPRVLHYFFFCLFAGTRRDEALNLRGRDFDLKNKIIYIHGTKTNGSDRRIPMFPILEKIFNLYHPTAHEKLFNVSQHRADADFQLFRGEMDDAVLHWLRHTFGTVQICVLGINVNTVALWMGHANPSTTMKIYTHPENLAPDIFFSGLHSEAEKLEILHQRYNQIVSKIEKMLELPTI